MGKPTEDHDGGYVELEAQVAGPGELPVPISVWRVMDMPRDEPARGGGLTPRLAALLVALYTRVGDTIIDVTADPTIAGAAGAGGRRYLPLAGPAGLIALRSVRSTVALIVLRWPEPEGSSRPADLATVLATCRRVLAGRGFAVVALVPPAGRTYLEQVQHLMPAAQRAGLRYLEHVIAVTASALAGTTTAGRDRGDLSAAGGLHLDLLVLVVRGSRQS